MIPLWLRLLGVLAALVLLAQALRGTNGEEIKPSECYYSDMDDDKGVGASILLLLAVFAVGMIIGYLLRGLGVPPAAAPGAELPVQKIIMINEPGGEEPRTTKKTKTANAMTMSQCTYKRWLSTPRFVPVCEAAQGAWHDW